MKYIPLGPLMIDIAGHTLTDLDRERLCHPLVGGIILFSRNYADREQLTALTREIHALRQPRLLIAVDHEGGRVQRFREGFTRLPSMRTLGQLYERDPEAGLSATRDVGFVLAAELRACGVDYSFTPVLDLDYGPSRVIGDRAFHRDPLAIIALASALGEGLKLGGMGTCGKHYPGHGYVIPDSHVELPIDDRPLDAMQDDLLPYRHLPLDAIMAAHVIYECFDCNTAVFSNRWIDYLRNDIKFNGVVFTDDLSMAGAGVVGDMLARVQTAYGAGCDMLLVCNSPDSVALVLENWHPEIDSARRQRVEQLAANAGQDIAFPPDRLLAAQTVASALFAAQA
ncbi:beta-N-acetylhexosaminidase [Dechloromonas denitrificans]|uniref:beta-N-acetylhexosaminidase n=1 Tax=Dechloromonas denitrificans TaxID=281362 RepID=UPI001CF899E8|nr:beta-N-acetylhexosaminidase [Dechloromonas denitrificans]UCV13125.1 beta-N-acetylhexosaminidase [Dechloromonas denitrificans]